MTPLYVTIDGVQKEITALPAMVDGVQTELNVLNATVDGAAREVFSAQSEGALPSGYTQLVYIESSGTQCIDTGFKPNQDTRVVAEMQLTATTASRFYFGVRTSSATVNFNVLNTSGGTRSDYGNSKVTSASITATMLLAIDKNRNICTINGVEIVNTESTFQSEYNLFLFACNSGGTTSFYGSVKCYSCQIYDNDTLIRDYVPCINPNGEYGLYDLVNGEFYGSAGTGAFTGEKSDAQLTRFAITHNGVSKIYVAEYGMTFEAWVASAYNTDGWLVLDDDDYVWDSGTVVAVCELGTTNFVSKTDVIEPNGEYGVIA